MTCCREGFRYQRLYAVLSVACLCLLSISVNAQTATSSAEIENRILITINDPGAARMNLSGRPGAGYRRRAPYVASFGAEKAADRVAEVFQLQRLDEWLIRPLSLFCLVYAVPEGVVVDELLEKLREWPEVESAQRLNAFEVSSTKHNATIVMPAGDNATGDPYAGIQHVVDTLELRRAHAWSTGGGVDVAIIDTGADFRHPDLKSQIAKHRSFVDDGGAVFTSDAHGTAVAGVIAAATENGFGIVGVAPAARMTILKACWYAPGRPAAVCNSFTIAKALAFAIEDKADLINLSLGGPADPLLSRLVVEAQQRGAIVIGAAPESDERGFPANIDGVIVVDSSDQIAPSANETIRAILAPGTDILVATPHGNFDFSSGNSLAAAHVTGIAALLVALEPILDGAQINAIIAASPLSVGASVNACRAIAQLVEESACRGSAVTVSSQ